MVVRSRNSLVLLASAILVLAVGETVLASGRIYGSARFEMIKGKPAAGYHGLYEFDLFLSPSGPSPTGPSRRLGTSRYTGGACDQGVGGGTYCIDTTAGTYSILVAQQEFWLGHPKVVPDVVITNGQTTLLNVEINIDYSTYMHHPSTNWDWTGAGNTWYQTYTATGSSVTGVSFYLADEPPEPDPDPFPADVSILEDNGSPDVRNWTVLGTRRHSNPGARTDNWVRWRSGEIPTTPGTQYAVRVAGVGRNIQPFKRNHDSLSYEGGQAYDASGNPYSFDLDYLVLANIDGTFVTLNKRTGGLGSLVTGYFDDGWGQTFTAQGRGLASVDVWAAGAEIPGQSCPDRWDLDFAWKVREGGPTGPQIGPTKTTKALSLASGVGLHGVSYNPDEVPLAPGQTYFIEFLYADGPSCAQQGLNPYITDDPYGGGRGYQWTGSSWIARTGDDVSMAIMEYEVTGPWIELNKTLITRSVFLGDALSNDVFTVRNSGDDTLVYAVLDGGAAWLTPTPDNGMATGETDVITISYNVGALACGDNHATIAVTGNADNSPQTIEVTVTLLSVPPDFDCDGDVDQQDFGHLQACYTGPGFEQEEPACLDALLDIDEDVDVDDFAILQGCMSGAGIPATTGCADD